jgi:hypothetical protein
MYIFIFYVLCFVKNGYFCGLCKKIKKMYHKKAYFSTEFCYFYINHIEFIFFLGPLREHVEHEDIDTRFLFEFFEFFKYV